MHYYILKRILQSIPILIGINILTFALFFLVNSPDDIAYLHLGGKYVSLDAIEDWKVIHGYNLPLFYNSAASGISVFTETIFWTKSLGLFIFDFGMSDGGRDISQAISERYLPSLMLSVPALLLGVLVNITVAMFLAFFRGTKLDAWGTFVCVVLMSISMLFYIVGGQYLFAKVLKWMPISGYTDGLGGIKFLILPVIISVLGGIGSGSRWYRTFFIEELNKDYVKAARAKGLSEIIVLFKHVLRNALIPILTGIVAILPLLFMGSLLTESFFAIPGLGSYTIDAIRQQDFAIVRSMVFLGSVLYILGLILTDISYVFVDPRVKLN